MSKIVVVDGYTLNPGDLSWAELESLGQCDIYDRTPRDKVIQRCKGADIIVTNKVVFDKEIIDALPDLKCISVIATGYNVIDVKYAREKGIIVTNVPTYGTQSVAQMTFALLLELAHHVGYHSETVKSGKWSRCEDFCYWDKPLIELAGLTMGLIGFGRIGQTVAKLAQAFGMNVIAYDVALKSDDTVDMRNVKFVELDEIFTRSDVISLHCPLTDENRGLINAETLAKMKNSAFLINTSRGPLINEQDLANALNEEKIAGAAVDVLTVEPPKENSPLMSAKNCYITPHIAWATRAARSRLMKIAIDNIRAFLKGKPQNVVN